VSDPYEAWNRALGERFLQSRADEPLYLYTDEGVLQEVAGEVGIESRDALAAFTSAVCDTLTGDQPFLGWERRTRLVPAGDPLPPHLAVLCFLVLVAVERDGTHFSYYPGLNKALGRPVDAGPPPGFDKHVGLLFQRFNEWLLKSKRGIPTAAKSASYPNVSWPLSQAVVRPSDRALLVRIFLDAALDARVARDAAWLRAKVLPRLWTVGDSPSRTRLLELAQHHGELFDSTVAQVYASWDGTSRLVAGPEFSNLKLCYEQLSGDWWLLGAPVLGTVGRRWRVGSASGVVRASKGFEAAPSDMWSLVGGGVIGRIEGGPRLRSPKKAARWLSIDTRAGGWAEVGARDVDADQHVVATHDVAAILATVDGAEPRGSTPSGGAVYFVPKGVVVDALATSSRGPQARLRGGLLLRAATRSYLLSPHGAPEVVLSGGLDDAQDHAVDIVPVEGLRLGPGDHVVEAGGHDLRLRLVDRILAPGEGSDESSWYDDLPEPVGIPVPHVAGTVWVIGQDGAAEERDVPRTRWLDDVGLYATAADVSAIVRSTQFEPLYVVSRPNEGRVWVTRVPEVLRVADPTAARRSYDRLAARKLVAHLLVDTRSGHIADDRTWKKTLAALMREVHQ
jgi:hypothetical protein